MALAARISKERLGWVGSVPAAAAATGFAARSAFGFDGARFFARSSVRVGSEVVPNRPPSWTGRSKAARLADNLESSDKVLLATLRTSP
jgi:hypothetical protein